MGAHGAVCSVVTERVEQVTVRFLPMLPIALSVVVGVSLRSHWLDLPPEERAVPARQSDTSPDLLLGPIVPP